MIKEYTNKFGRLSVVEKMIVVNVFVFLVYFLIKTFAFLYKLPENQLLEWLAFTNNWKELLYKPWTVITYTFLHDGFIHLLFNMVLLYFSGQFFITYFTGKQFLNFYFLGAIAGAIMYMVSFAVFPVFSGIERPMVGASAAVMAILVGIATHIPYMGVRLFLFGTVKLWHIALFFVVLDLVLIPAGNAGGRFAHLGGALLGFVYAKQLAKGNDIGKWWENIMDWVTGLFSLKKQKPLKTVYKRKNPETKIKPTDNKSEKQQKIDKILDKISKSGYNSLTKEEKEFLFKAGREE